MLLLAFAAAALATMPKPEKTWLLDARAMATIDAALDMKTAKSNTRVDLAVDAGGKPIRCDITVSGGVSATDKGACMLMMRSSSFVPGLDADGNPIAAVLRFDFKAERISLIRQARDSKHGPPVDFAIPVRSLPEGGPFSTNVVVTTDATGHPSHCDVATPSKLAQLDRLACAQMLETNFDPARDGGGQPVRALRGLTIGFVAPGTAAN